MSLLAIKNFLASIFTSLIRMVSSAGRAVAQQSRFVDEASPVSPDEIILRRVPRAHYKGQPLSVSIEAFRPTEPKPAKNIAGDMDGLSVSREACGATPNSLVAHIEPARRSDFVVARLRASDFLELGLSIQPSPVAGSLGHAIIPELSWPAYSANKRRCKELQEKLAGKASRDVVDLRGLT
jgi:hypothetical protein